MLLIGRLMVFLLVAWSLPSLACKPAPLPVGMTVSDYAKLLFDGNEAIFVGKVLSVSPQESNGRVWAIKFTLQVIEPIKGHAGTRTVYTPPRSGSCGMADNAALREGETRLLVLKTARNIYWPDNYHRSFDTNQVIEELRRLKEMHRDPNRALQPTR